MTKKSGFKILITGGAGFIGSNLCEYFINNGHSVVCLDNLSTGFIKNIETLTSNDDFKFIHGDIRDLKTCLHATQGVDFVLHHAALGSVTRSINDPLTTNEVNIGGFINMLTASRDNNVKRFIYAASSSTYGSSPSLPKIEEIIGKPLSPYAVTKYVNELYADVFSRTYNMELIGLRYFNVFGMRQNPNGDYAAVIPLWVKQLIHHESPVINGNGTFSRDFTFISNVIEANEKSIMTNKEKLLTSDGYFHQVLNIAYGNNTTLNELFTILKDNLAKYDREILLINPKHGPERLGDIPHSLACINKAREVIGYSPKFSARSGFEIATEWYWNHLSQYK